MRKLAVLAALVLTCGCDSTKRGDPPQSGAAPAQVPARSGQSDAVALALLRPSAAGATAAIAGTLVRDDRCLVLDAGDRRFNLAFAISAVEWDGERAALRVAGRDFPIGSTISLGGAEYRGDHARLAWLQPPGEGCGGNLWIVSAIEPG